MSGYVTFSMDGRELAASLDQVREVVRATGIEQLRGVRAPVTGLLELRGQPLPVVDLRSPADPGALGDVLVLIDAVTDGGPARSASPSTRCSPWWTRRRSPARPSRRPAGCRGTSWRCCGRRTTSSGRCSSSTCTSSPGSAHRPALRRPRGADLGVRRTARGSTTRPAGTAPRARSGPGLADALDGLQVVDAGGQQLLQAAEVVDEPVDHAGRAAAAPGPAAGSRAGVTAASSVSSAPRSPSARATGGEVEQVAAVERVEVGERLRRRCAAAGRRRPGGSRGPPARARRRRRRSARRAAAASSRPSVPSSTT